MLKPRECIAKLEPYQSPIIRREQLNLDLNENTAGCSPRVLARLQALTKWDVAMYPQREAGEQRVADFLGVAPAQLLLHNGVDEGLYLLFATYLREGDEMIFADPTFVMYSIYARATGADLIRIQTKQNLEFPVEQVLEEISPRTRMIAIANPNNPTGRTVPRTALLQILEKAENAAVLVDEAYFEFGGETLVPDLPHHSNLFVARTFSKAYGLAGLRLGALIGPPEQIGYLRRFCPPFNVNAVALACLEEALDDQSFVRDYVAQVQRGREQIAELCQELGLKYWPSSANFVLVRVGPSVKAFVEAMQRRGIMIRDLSASPGCQGSVRIGVPTSEQIDALLVAMHEAFEEVRSIRR
jgi:histidinol-phosphate aminotransferase